MPLINTKERIEYNKVKKIRTDTDDVCSSYIDFESPKSVVVDGIYYGSLLVINYQREMEELFLDKILSLDIDIQLSIYYQKLNSYEVIKELTYNIGNTGATIKTTNENQQDMEVAGSTYSDAKLIRKQLQLGEEELFDLTICIGVFANSVMELETSLQRIESFAISSGLTTIRGNYRQEEAFYSMLPFNSLDDELNKVLSRNVLTTGLVATYPFVSNELFDNNGILLGTNTFDNSIILFDRFDTNKYKNANMFVVGTSGSGKSYFVKLMINRNRFLNITQYIIDPDREYTRLCQNLNGSIVNFGKEQVINVFDIREGGLEEGESYLRTKVAKLKAFFSMVFEKMTPDEEALLEEELIELYKEKGITDDNSTLIQKDERSILLDKKVFKDSAKMPRFEDFLTKLKKNKVLKKYASLLKPYTQGTLKYLNNYTNIDINNKLVVVDIHNVQEAEMPVVMFIITDFFWDQIKKDRTQKKILYLDEVWKMINKNEYTADFVFKLFKTIRKFGGAATAITQDISDFFMLDDGKYGKGIINNSSSKCLFQLEENDIEFLEKAMNISDEEKYKLLNMKRGSTIIHAGRNTLMVDVIASKKEHECINTDYINEKE